jgi:hypothetical protein
MDTCLKVPLRAAPHRFACVAIANMRKPMLAGMQPEKTDEDDCQERPCGCAQGHGRDDRAWREGHMTTPALNAIDAMLAPDLGTNLGQPDVWSGGASSLDAATFADLVAGSGSNKASDDDDSDDD